MLRIRVAAIGAAAGILLLGLIPWLGGGYLGIITRDPRVEAQLTTTGDSLGVNSDVKFRGMRVGRVLEVRTGTRPSARIVLSQEHAEMIPSDVVARVLPGTLFGNEYVDLVSNSKDLEAIEPIEAIEPGAVIKADTSVETLRLMDTLSSAQRLLAALDPASLDTAISHHRTRVVPGTRVSCRDNLGSGRRV